MQVLLTQKPVFRLGGKGKGMHPKNGKNKPVIWIKYRKMWIDNAVSGLHRFGERDPAAF